MVKQLDLFLSDFLSPGFSVSLSSTLDSLIISELVPRLAAGMARLCSSLRHIHHLGFTCPISWLSEKTHGIGILST